MPIRGKRGNENEELRLLITETLRDHHSFHLNLATGTVHFINRIWDFISKNILVTHFHELKKSLSALKMDSQEQAHYRELHQRPVWTGRYEATKIFKSKSIRDSLWLFTFNFPEFRDLVLIAFSDNLGIRHHVMLIIYCPEFRVWTAPVSRGSRAPGAGPPPSPPQAMCHPPLAWGRRPRWT